MTQPLTSAVFKKLATNVNTSEEAKIILAKEHLDVSNAYFDAEFMLNWLEENPTRVSKVFTGNFKMNALINILIYKDIKRETLDAILSACEPTVVDDLLGLTSVYSRFVENHPGIIENIDDEERLKRIFFNALSVWDPTLDYKFLPRVEWFKNKNDFYSCLNSNPNVKMLLIDKSEDREVLTLVLERLLRESIIDTANLCKFITRLETLPFGQDTLKAVLAQPRVIRDLKARISQRLDPGFQGLSTGSVLCEGAAVFLSEKNLNDKFNLGFDLKDALVVNDLEPETLTESTFEEMSPMVLMLTPKLIEHAASNKKLNEKALTGLFDTLKEECGGLQMIPAFVKSALDALLHGGIEMLNYYKASKPATNFDKRVCGEFFNCEDKPEKVLVTLAKAGFSPYEVNSMRFYALDPIGSGTEEEIKAFFEAVSEWDSYYLEDLQFLPSVAPYLPVAEELEYSQEQIGLQWGLTQFASDLERLEIFLALRENFEGSYQQLVDACLSV